MFSTEVLEQWAAVDGRYVKRDLDRKAPNRVLREADGSEVVCTDTQGRKGHITLSDEMMDDFVRQSFARREDDGTFRLTVDGLVRGK